MPARILIIEDDSFSRELVKYLVEAAGYWALGAEDGAYGLQVALRANPDLILCDVQMPEMNGFEVIKSLRSSSQWRPVPVLAVTAFSMPGDREAALTAGFDDHITKPIVPETFIRQLEAYLPPHLRASSTPST